MLFGSFVAKYPLLFTINCERKVYIYTDEWESKVGKWAFSVLGCFVLVDKLL